MARLTNYSLIRLVAVCFLLPCAIQAALDAPVSPNAQPGVASLMRVLDRISGRYILSGQQELGWDAYRVDEDIAYVEKTTGKTPVIRGLDFGDYTSEVGIRAEAQKRRAGNCVMISNPVSLATG